MQSIGDTRSRRAVVGQVLEYAANGPFYWDKEKIREYAEASAEKRGISLDKAWRAIRPKEWDSLDSFLDSLVSNLSEGQIRIMFFMEQAPRELKSIVDFLNKQMARSEVLLVEAHMDLWPWCDCGSAISLRVHQEKQGW